MGKLLVGSNQKIFVVILTDYFMKWIEAEAFTRICDCEVMQFLWMKIICGFGMLKDIVSDNRAQFVSFNFQDFFAK